MRNRLWPSLAMLAAPVLVVVALSMPWEAASCGTSGSNFFNGRSSTPSAGLRNLISCSTTRIDGWSTLGDVAAVASVLLAVLAGYAVFCRSSRRALPLIGSALLLTYFTVAVAVESGLHASDVERQLAQPGGAAALDFHMAYGAYVGLVGATVAFAAAVMTAGAAIVRPSLRTAAMTAVALGLLVALLLPGQRVGIPAASSQIGVASPSGTLAAALAICLVALSSPSEGARSAERLAVVVGIGLFVVATFDVGFAAERSYGVWLALAFAVLLLSVSAFEAAGMREIRPGARDVAVAIAGAAFIGTLFLPWQDACYGENPDLRAMGLSGRCVSWNGFGLVGSTAALFAVALLAVTLLPVARFPSRRELAAPFAVLVATMGFQLSDEFGSGVHLRFGYGSILGLVVAAVLVALSVVPSVRPAAIVWMPDASFVVPLLLAVAYVTAVVLPWWGVLPNAIWATFVPRLAGVSWLTVTSAIVGVRLVQLWARKALTATGQAPGLVASSLALLALTILETLPLPTVRLTWNMAVLLGLAVPLALFAVVDARGGLRYIQIPEILRIDRLGPPSAE